ncbi:MAG: FkbM family methyltransferase [Cycloclasticus sp.]|jgi:FkbM family methyltransferase
MVINGIPISEFKGQKTQDQWVVSDVFKGKRDGCFLDLAAADGVLHSNTYVLEKQLNWQGLCVEPNPRFFEELKSNRNCHVANTVISDTASKLKFRVDNGQLGGVVAEDTDNNYDVRGSELTSESAEILELDAIDINSLLAQYKAPKHIDYFSLDVEGCEERIISTLDFNSYTFGCITIERPTPKVNEIVLANGYVFVKNFKFDSFYLHPDVQSEAQLKCDPFEQIPPKDW